MLATTRHTLAPWVGRDRDFFLMWVLFAMAVQCLALLVYIFALAKGWITYPTQTTHQAWSAWAIELAIWFGTSLLYGLTHSWLIGARLGTGRNWFYIIFLSALISLLFNSLLVWLFGLPRSMQPFIGLGVDLVTGFIQARFLSRFSSRAFAWMLVPLCATDVYTALATLTGRQGVFTEYMGSAVGQICMAIVAGLVITWILRETARVVPMQVAPGEPAPPNAQPPVSAQVS